jgi:hypothetical protein
VIDTLDELWLRRVITTVALPIWSFSPSLMVKTNAMIWIPSKA